MKTTAPALIAENRSSGAPARAFLTALIIGAALLVYAPVFRAGFIWDDDAFLTGNRLIHARDGLRSFWFSKAPPDYFPLTSSMLWFEWRLWGTNAAGYHLVNVLLHAASAVLLWRVLLRLRIPGAWLAGLLFAVHPVTVESVAWITERKNTLSMALYLASLLAWMSADCRLQIADSGTHLIPHSGAARSAFHSAFRALHSALCNPYYGLSLGLFLLALLAKTSVIMLPAVLLLCAWWRRGRISLKDLARSLPFFALALAMGLVTVWFQNHNVVRGQAVRTDGLAERAACAGWAVWFYLYKALLPVKLCFVYPRWMTSASLEAFVPGLLLVGMLVLFAWFRRGWGRPLLFALGYFIIALLPVLGFLNIYFMRYSLVADHWQYPALIGVIALTAGLLGWVMERPGAPVSQPVRRSFGAGGSPGGGGRRTAAKVAAGALVLACAVLSFRQMRIYHDVETLWNDTLAKNPKSWLAQNNRVALLLQKAIAPGADSARLLGEAERGVEESLRDLDETHAPKFFYAESYGNRGTIRAAEKCYEEAIRDYDQAIALNASKAETWFDRGVAYAKINRPQDALRDLDRAILLDSDDADSYCIRGGLLLHAKRYAEAIRDYDQALALRPDDAEALSSRADACARAGRPEEALRSLDRALALRPGDAEGYCNRGDLYLDAHRCIEAILDYDRAIGIKPDYADAWYNRANACLADGRTAEAVRDYGKAIELRPQDPDAWYNRGMAHRRMKQNNEALADLLMARKLGAAVPEELLRSLGSSAQPAP